MWIKVNYNHNKRKSLLNYAWFYCLYRLEVRHNVEVSPTTLT